MIGRSPDSLSLPEQMSLAGKVVAYQVYTPQNLAQRRIEAVGDTTVACIAQLASRGLDPVDFEFVQYRRPLA